MDTSTVRSFNCFELTAFSVFDIFENLSIFIEWIIYWFKVLEMERRLCTENDTSREALTMRRDWIQPSHMIWWFDVGFASENLCSFTIRKFECQRKYTYQFTLACHSHYTTLGSVATGKYQKHSCLCQCASSLSLSLYRPLETNINENVSVSFLCTMPREKLFTWLDAIYFNGNFVVRSSLMQLHKLTYRTFAIWILHRIA